MGKNIRNKPKLNIISKFESLAIFPANPNQKKNTINKAVIITMGRLIVNNNILFIRSYSAVDFSLVLASWRVIKVINPIRKIYHNGLNLNCINKSKILSNITYLHPLKLLLAYSP